MIRYPNLETAIRYCRQSGIKFEYKATSCNHFKFYINGTKKYILISPKNDNRDRVIKDIRRIMNG